MNRVPKKPVDKKNIPGFKLYGYNICKRLFLYLMNISNHKYKNIASHYNSNGLISRQHWNKGRLPSNTTSFEATEQVKSFITSYARDNALPLPGRVPGHRDETHLVLSSSECKKDIWDSYSAASQEAGIRPV